MARDPTESTIVDYKIILLGIIDMRPSGTRQRLADALGKHRSFVTQITSPTYSTPLPARHLPTIFKVCHFSPAEQERFLKAYQLAHPGRLPDLATRDGVRQMSLTVPDFGNEKKNRMFDEAIEEFILKMARLSESGE
ncbi:hypothetical protein [Rhizobium tubonense]|uniref:Uncharacterized protein n=1 Tax=Rhizobium tubonense TaxID=484088 RepID=A0A2W4D1S3_9HYPH|nr:hypothetical protein [Rhizobium tubonense]PZM16255.1 hypothetical protein CPY51_04545 [Rhizobium tubonense]